MMAPQPPLVALLLTLLLGAPQGASMSSMSAMLTTSEGAPPHAVSGQPAQPPTVRLLATGGTISNRPGGRLTAKQLADSVPNLDQHVVVESEQFANVASSSLTLDQWVKLSRRINQLFTERAELDGVVVTSGTDTLEEVAYFLHLTVRSDRPVVVVGAMRPPQALGYDGAANLLQAFRVAAEPAAMGRGVLVVLNNEIHSAREVTKTDARSLGTFSSRGYGILGRVDSDDVIFYRSVDRRHTRESEFDIDGFSTLPRVDVLLAYQDAPGDLVHAAIEAGAEGLVLAGLGTGGAGQSQRDAILAVIENGTPVVVTTRTGGGRVLPTDRRADQTDASQDGSLGLDRIAGEDLSPVKARILLMLGLTVTAEREALTRMFSEY